MKKSRAWPLDMEGKAKRELFTLACSPDFSFSSCILWQLNTRKNLQLTSGQHCINSLCFFHDYIHAVNGKGFAFHIDGETRCFNWICVVLNIFNRC